MVEPSLVKTGQAMPVFYDELDLAPDPVSTQVVSRDRHAEFLQEGRSLGGDRVPVLAWFGACGRVRRRDVALRDHGSHQPDAERAGGVVVADSRLPPGPDLLALL